MTANRIEELEQITDRIVLSLLSRTTIDQAATTENITTTENTKEPVRRKSFYSTGAALGYIAPMGTSFSSESTGTYSQLIRFSWLNTWEFQNKYILDAEFLGFLPASFGGDINMLYVPSNTDVAPFVGGGLGLHYVVDKRNVDLGKRNSGPAFNVQGGLLLFRTYDIHLIVRGQYHVILNSDIDHGPSADLALTFQKKEGRNRSSGWGTFFMYYLVVVLIGGVISGLSS